MNEPTPEIVTYISYSWDCPICGETNDAEYDGDCFKTPLVCSACKSKFDDYTESGIVA